MNNTDNKLHLNRHGGIVGGVCAGLADYFNISRLLVRIITIIAALTWWPTVVVYIILYFCLSDKKPTLSEIGENISQSKLGRHFKQVNYRKRIYKNRHNKKIAGVCSGIADYLEINPFIVRLLALLSLFFGPFAIIAYIVAYVVMDTNPDDNDYVYSRRARHRDSGNPDSCEPPRKQHQGRSFNKPFDKPFDKRDIEDCADKFSDLERKLERLEATITSKKFKLHREFKRMAT